MGRPMRDKSYSLRNFKSKGGNYGEHQGWIPNRSKPERPTSRQWLPFWPLMSGVNTLSCSLPLSSEWIARENNLKGELKSQHPSRNSIQHEADMHPCSRSLEMASRRPRAMEAKQDDEVCQYPECGGGAWHIPAEAGGPHLHPQHPVSLLHIC